MYLNCVCKTKVSHLNKIVFLRLVFIFARQSETVNTFIQLLTFQRSFRTEREVKYDNQSPQLLSHTYIEKML